MLSFELFADYYQLYLIDDRTPTVDWSTAWDDPAAHPARMATVPGFVAIGTRRNMTVPVELSITPSPDELDPRATHVVEGDLEVETGRIVVMGCTDVYADATRVPVGAGRYRVRSTHLPIPGEQDAFGPHRRYQITLWPSDDERPVSVLVREPE